MQALDDGDKKEALDRLNKSLGSRLQIYQSDWRLQLLLPLAMSNRWRSPVFCSIPFCRYVDILLGTVDDHYLHLLDRHALDLRHITINSPMSIIRSHVDGDAYASAALHCMRFLANVP